MKIEKENFSITILRKRLLAIIIAVTFLFLFVLGRLFYVQVIWGEHLQEKAIDQWTREIPVVATRGNIIDRNGVVISCNDDTYTVFVRKKAIQDKNSIVDNLSKILSLDKQFVLNKLEKTHSSEVTIKKQVKKVKLTTFYP